MSDDGHDGGFKKPPKHKQFKPGQSGNPSGRPKGVRNFKTDLQAALKAPIRVSADGKPKTVSTQVAALMRLREKALKGDTRALDRLLALAQTYNSDELAAPSMEQLPPEDDAILRLFFERRYGVPNIKTSDDPGPEDA